MFFTKGWFLKIFFLCKLASKCNTCVSKDMVKQYRNIFSKQSKYAYNIVKTDNIEIKLGKISHKCLRGNLVK